MATQSPQDMYWSMSPVTRGYMTLVVLTTCASALGLVHPFSLILDWQAVFYRFEVRLLRAAGLRTRTPRACWLPAHPVALERVAPHASRALATRPSAFAALTVSRALP